MNEQPDFFEEPEEIEGPLPPDHPRKCNACGDEYWCRVTRSRPTYVPLHCDRCAEEAAEDLRRRTAIWREKMRTGELRWKKRLAGDKPWEKNPDFGRQAVAGEVAAAGFDALLTGAADDLIRGAKTRAKKK